MELGRNVLPDDVLDADFSGFDLALLKYRTVALTGGMMRVDGGEFGRRCGLEGDELRVAEPFGVAIALQVLCLSVASCADVILTA